MRCSWGLAPCLCLALLVWAETATGAAGTCEVGRYLDTDGYTFRFNLDVRFATFDDEDVAGILESDEGAFSLYAQGPAFGDGKGKVGFQITLVGGEQEDVVSQAALTSGAWHSLTVEKAKSSLCIRVDTGADACVSSILPAVSFRMKDPGQVQVGNATGLETRGYAQSPVIHYQFSGAQTQYFLVALTNGLNFANPPRDDYTDTSNPAWGEYVKPRFGTFTRLRYECGYEMLGTLGYIELAGEWTWEPAGWLTAVTAATKVEGNAFYDPALPGWAGDAFPGYMWQNSYPFRNYPSFGVGALSEVDGQPGDPGMFACEPLSSDYGLGNHRWVDSPIRSDRRYIRLFLGGEPGNTTSTTTRTCSSTTVTSSMTSTSITSTSSSSSSSTSSISMTTSTTSSSRTASTSTTSSTLVSSVTSTTRSVTSTGTSITTTTTSTTTFTLPEAWTVPVLLRWVSGLEKQVVQQFMNAPPNTSSISMRVAGASLTAFAMSGEEPPQGTPLAVGDLGVQAQVPPAARGNKQSAIGVVTALDIQTTDRLVGTPVLSGVNINLFDDSHEVISVSDLSEKVVITMPAVDGEDFVCPFWDVGLGDWSLAGIERLSAGNGFVTCAATHLTLFGSIAQAAFNTFACAQIALLTPDAMSRLFKGDWWQQPWAVSFWVLLACLAALFPIACIADVWGRENSWDDECFLVPWGEPPADAEDEEEEELGPRGCCSRRLRALLECCRESSALRDVVDDVCSRWFRFFSQVRGVCEAVLCTFCNREVAEARGTRLSRALTGTSASLMLTCTKMQVAASLRIDGNDVDFLLHDEDLGELLQGPSKTESAGSGKWEKHLRNWRDLHGDVLQAFDRHWRGMSYRALPCVSLRLLSVGVPFVSVFLHCNLMPSSLRLLFFTAELLGMLMLTTLLYQASGEVSSVVNQDQDSCESATGVGAEIGRVIGVTIGSLIVSSLPLALITSLHSRSFRRLPYQGCPEWKQQLKTWRFQDRVVWCVGLIYIAFCVIFVAAFLANVGPGELPVWGTAGALTLAEDCLFIPFGLSLLVPFLAVAVLGTACRVLGVSWQDLLLQTKRLVEDGAGNYHQLHLSL